MKAAGWRERQRMKRLHVQENTRARLDHRLVPARKGEGCPQGGGRVGTCEGEIPRWAAEVEGFPLSGLLRSLQMRRRVSHQGTNRRKRLRDQDRVKLAVKNREGPGGHGWGQQREVQWRGRTAVRGTVERACSLLIAACSSPVGSVAQWEAERQPDLQAQRALSGVVATGQ